MRLLTRRRARTGKDKEAKEKLLFEVWKPMKVKIKPRLRVTSTSTDPGPFLSCFPTEKPMTPFESLLWNVWLPKVRTSINNNWNPQTPQPAVKLQEAQLESEAGGGISVEHCLSLAQARKRRGSPASSHGPEAGGRAWRCPAECEKLTPKLERWRWSPGDSGNWREVYDAGEWDAMLLKYVVPQFGASLREGFRIKRYSFWKRSSLFQRRCRVWVVSHETPRVGYSS
ncbi:hypothetical protein R3P38DRAFT_3015127 [Favolaschia claudopus]|uniref:Uncharacterized protein n=1 Tax=Favolaschia claudopus TaxID=2862362 RepID=A0AAW0AJX3_9AGAR